jgi:hypothetical protein
MSAAGTSGTIVYRNLFLSSLLGPPHPVLAGTNHFSMSDSAISLELKFCVAAAALILAISAKPCQKGEADPRGLRR